MKKRSAQFTPSMLAAGLLLISLTPETLSSQVKIGTPPGPPHPSAVLELESTTSGFLPPRMTETERNAISAPATGLIIYNTDADCIQAYMPTGWKDVSCKCNTYPNPSFTVGGNVTTSSPQTFTATEAGHTYAWTFNGANPASATGQSANTQWSAASTYNVTLVVTNSQGCSDSSTQQITVINCPAPFQNTQTFSYTGGVQSFVVPSTCVNTIQVEVWGAQGATTGSSQAGKGGYVKGELAVTPGETLYVYVGGQNGYNGGGAAGTGGTSSYSAGNGGGASDIRRGGQSLNDRVVVAGGGGGAGRQSCSAQTGGDGGYPGGNGGLGGGNLSGGNGSTNGGSVSGGGGGSSCTSSARGGGGGGQNGGGGAGGYGSSTGGTNGGCGSTNSDPFGGSGTANQPTGGCFGTGGDGGSHGNNGGGGGGGGWYGGGAGGGNWASGGGGGSSYIGTLSNVTTQTGVRTGNGQIIITW